MRDILQDIRYGLRSFKANPAFTIVAVLALALGIGATTAIFSVVDRVMLRPLPYPEPERLVSVGYTLAHHDYFDWRARNHVFEDMAIVRGPSPATLTGLDEASQLDLASATASFFQVFRVQPMMGRPFTEAEDKPGAPKVLLLTYSAWQTRFGGARDILGRSLTLNDTPYTVIGVMAPSFRYPAQDKVEAIKPLALDTTTQSMYFVRVVGRLKAGVKMGEAAAEMRGLFEHGVSNQPFGGRKQTLSVVGLQERQVADVRLAMLALLGSVACVLLIACANVANLLLSRSTARRGELAVRAALGAGRIRLVRQLLTESVLLGLTGGASGLLLAALSLKSIVHLAPSVARIEDVAIDWRVLGFTAAVSLAVSLLFGLAPAFSAARVDLNEALKRSSRSTTAKNRIFRSALVMAEVALSLVLLTGAGLLVQTLWRLEQVQTGIVSEHVLTVDVDLSYKRYPTPRRMAFFADVLDRVSSLPGVIAAGGSAGLPMSAPMAVGMAAGSASPPENVRAEDWVLIKDVTPGYFAALGIPLREGRLFSARERQGADAAIVNETLARHFFPNEDPIGKQMSAGRADHVRTIIGVVGDVKNRGRQVPAQAELYRIDQEGNVGSLVIRTAGDPLGVTSLIREQVRTLDKNTPLTFTTMTEQLDTEFTSQRFNSILLSAFAGIALLLAAIGIYGVMSYLVSLRTQEIGIRMALGARMNQVMGLVMGHAFRLILGGVAAGAALAVGLTRYLSSLLYGVTANDALTLCAVAFLIAAVALFASYFPALRASRVDPLTALRSE
jgi:putative ABC transport system permease protein